MFANVALLRNCNYILANQVIENKEKFCHPTEFTTSSNDFEDRCLAQNGEGILHAISIPLLWRYFSWEVFQNFQVLIPL